MRHEEARAYIENEFEKHVPSSGRSDTLYGEIIRAITRICYRYYNDGDKIGIGYGNRTCNAAARFLIDKCGGDIEKRINRMWGTSFKYEKELKELECETAKYLKENKDVLLRKETCDMFNYMMQSDCDNDEEE